MALEAGRQLGTSAQRRSETSLERGSVIDVEASDDLTGVDLMSEAPAVLAVVRAICRDEGEAGDVLGRSLELAWRSRSQLRSRAALRPWLIRIAVREALRARRRLLGLRPIAAAEQDVAWLEPSSIEVRDTLAKLPRRTRLAVILRYAIGMSVSEVALALGTSPNTVKSQLRSGLARLRTELADE